MSEQKREVEARGATVDAAIENGLRKLGVARKAVEITVLDEGSRGLLGIGARDAVVRLVVMSKPAAKPTPPPARPKPQPKPAPEPAPKPEPKPEPEPKPQRPQRVETPPTAVAPPTPEPAVEPAADTGDEEAEKDTTAEEANIAQNVIEDLLGQMDVVASVSVRQSDPDDITGERVNIIDVEGDDLTVLIGPRGETLDALQYISRLMVGHQMRQRAQFVVDVQGYRARREQALGRMAERMAQKAIKRQEPVTLEPMPAYDRRIIHMTLRDSDEVYTESAGEGNRRRVRIYPK